MSSFGSLDGDKLNALSALLDEGSVSRAARRLAMPQPTLSHLLQKFREIFDDPLLVRAGNHMVLTPRAEALRVPLRSALCSLAELARGPHFSPELAQAHFRVASTDFMAGLLFPQVTKRLRNEAPGISLSIENWGTRRTEDLAQPILDLGIGTRTATESGIYQRRLFEERFVCVASRSNRRAHKGLTAAEFAALPHMQLSVKGLGGGGAVDRALARQGLRRSIVLSVAHFWLAADFLEGTDLVLTVPERLYRRLRSTHSGLKLVPLPVEVPNFTVQLFWHERLHHDPAHQWLRDCIFAAAPGAARASAG